MSSPDGRGVEGLRGIGETARESGLPVGTLRFYDGAGLLRPASVDPRTGYRFYTPEQVGTARLVAVLRDAGMPLAGIRTILRCVDDPAAVTAVCEAHLLALEHDLADARRLLSTVTSLIDPEESPMDATTITVPAAELAAALRAVRPAVSADPELPALCGVLFDAADTALTLVATDRYRLHTASVPAVLTGPATSVLVPSALVDGLAGLLGDGEVTITVAGALIVAATTAGRVEGGLPAAAFPDWRTLLPVRPGAQSLAAATIRSNVDAPAAAVRTGAGGLDREFSVLDAGADAVWADREFLRSALDSAGADAVVELEGPVAPIVVRGERRMALVMPARA
jgi:DNA polymerase III subunit beta